VKRICRKNEKETRKKYLERRKELRKLLEKKQKEKREEEEEKLKKLKREADVWKYINRKRGKKDGKRIIKNEEWRKYFKELLDGTEVNENKVQQNTGQLSEPKEEEENEEEGLKVEEIGRALRKMKKKKTVGIDDYRSSNMQVRVYGRG